MAIIFLKLKKILMIFILTLIFFEANCQAGRYDEFEDESCCSGTLRTLSNVFSCLFGDCIEASSGHHYERVDYDEVNEIEGFVLANTENPPIGILPKDMLYKVALFLSPPDIINLTKSNKQFFYLRGNDFWLYYNQAYNYFSWYEETPAVKVTFSYYWFRNNKVRKAAAMGLPRAREFIKQQEKLKRESPKSYEISSDTRHDHYDKIMHRAFFYKGGFYKKHW